MHKRIISKVPRPAPAPIKLLSVAAYARVSSGKDAMLQSLAAQVSYYSDFIQKRAGWQFAGIYSDECITYGQRSISPYPFGVPFPIVRNILYLISASRGGRLMVAYHVGGLSFCAKLLTVPAHTVHPMSPSSKSRYGALATRSMYLVTLCLYYNAD